jgi:hypothetical protein
MRAQVATFAGCLIPSQFARSQATKKIDEIVNMMTYISAILRPCDLKFGIHCSMHSNLKIMSFGTFTICEILKR